MRRLVMYERGDSNPHAKKAPGPKPDASTNSATLALPLLIIKLISLQI